MNKLAIAIGTIILGSVTLVSGKVIYDKYLEESKVTTYKPASTIENCSDGPTIAVVESLRRAPNDWETDNYRLSRGDKVSVWVANEEYGISISLGADARPDAYESMSDECKALLFRETQNWYKEKLNERLR